MLRECVEALHLQPGGLYVDATFGGGGHSKAILENSSIGHLYAFDQDADAALQSTYLEGSDSRFTFIQANFRFLKMFLQHRGVSQVHGILADLGISSYQIDTPDRGFATRFNGPLDMRMDRKQTLTAAEVVNTYPEEQLHKILGMYGEIRNARTLAAALVRSRSESAIHTTGELAEICKPLAPAGKHNRYLAQVFQAIRIEVNREMEALYTFLDDATSILQPGGRLVVLTYHSLEDRPVKHYLSKGKLSGMPEKDFYGNLIRPFEPWKPQTPTSEEMVANPRARSATLRVGIRNA
jgi:16S rRNA (cytosine1402-N4)-methyltransferase